MGSRGCDEFNARRLREVFAHCKAVDGGNYFFIIEVILEVFRVQFGSGLGKLFRGICSFDSQLFQAFLAP